ncbi:MAG: radical SAM protein [Dehalococcoidia bacterium]|nr:radical SAM protein [Dehalococcoidia bacterium]
MISISRLLCGGVATGDNLRYGKGAAPNSPLKAPKDGRPIVVWNCTQRCNLHCVHCYSNSTDKPYDGELSTAEAKKFIQDVAEFGIPVLLFSGGEPLLRPDLFELATFARSQGLRPVISTNGTLIDEAAAERLARVGFGEIGISLDGIGESNDRFRGKQGAYNDALQAIRNCIRAGQKVSLRFTITGQNVQDLGAIFDLVEKEGIPRVCFYHLAYSGRGAKIQDSDITHEQTRAAVDYICSRTQDFYKRGLEKEVLTVDNHTDAVYLYQKIRKEMPHREAEVLKLLTSNGGNKSGISISCVDNLGNVHADQFWWHYSFGSVKQRKFGDIWLDTSDDLMKGLKNRSGLLKGRCGRCHYVNICNGNLRVRAEAVYGDVWAEDPACYLTEEEISG